jgi:hypothetical protein
MIENATLFLNNTGASMDSGLVKANYCNMLHASSRNSMIFIFITLLIFFMLKQIIYKHPDWKFSQQAIRLIEIIELEILIAGLFLTIFYV